MQNLVLVLDAKSQAPNIEKSNFGAVFDDKKIVDENFVFMPIEVAKELSLSLLTMTAACEKRTGVRVKLPQDKQKLWDELIQTVNRVAAEENEKKDEEVGKIA